IMVNANEWLNKTIPADKREQATTLYIYRKCQCNISFSTESPRFSTKPSGFGFEETSPGLGFGTTSVTTSPGLRFFGLPVTTSSGFGFGATPVTTSSVFGFGATSVATPSGFAKPVTTPSVFAKSVTTSSEFGFGATPVTTSSGFGFGATPVTTSSGFGFGLFGSAKTCPEPPAPRPKLFEPVTTPPEETERPTMEDSNNYCQSCNANDQDNYSRAPDYCFYNVILEGELDLNDFINLQILYIEGTEQDKKQQQKLTSLKIDKCINLIHVTVNNTTLGCLSLGIKPKLQSTNFLGNKQLIFRDNIFKNQVEKLSSLILNTTKNVSLNDLRLEIKKIEEENL
ncbi:12432_t:CDS:1, partial [Dentiscutata heterogama]